MKKIFILSIFSLLTLLSKTALCQDIIDTPITHFIEQPKVYKTFLVKGRLLNINLNALPGVTVTNTRTAEKISTDNNGIYQLNVAKGDTIVFELPKLSKETRIVKNEQEALNIILISKSADRLPLNSSADDLRKAKKADDELYRILEKDAKLEKKWIY